MAQDVVTTLQRLARQGRTIVTTIHQPSYKVFKVRLLFVLVVCVRKGGKGRGGGGMGGRRTH